MKTASGRILFMVACALSGVVAGAAAAAAAGRPNILFCIADDASYPHAGAYGCPWVRTPAFDRVAREGLLFANAYTPNAKCAPSRSCVLTGRNSWQLGAAANHWPFFPREYATYAEALGSNGYFVGFTGKGWAPGIAEGRQLAGAPFSRRTAPPPARGISATDYAANFEDFLEARPAGRPFCFWYGGHEPHRGYEFGSGVAKGGRTPADVDRVPSFWPDTEIVRKDLLDYAFEIEHFDRHLGRMLDALEKRGELDNTLVVVTADNGLPFPRCKGNAYELSNHMPLAARWPKGIRNPGRTVKDYVSFIDFAPTFLEIAGVPAGASGMQPFAGRSLTDLFRGETPDPARDRVLIGQERHDVGRPYDWGYPVRGIFRDGWLFVRNAEPSRWPAGNPETGYLNTDGGPTKTVVLQGRTNGAPRGAEYWALSFGRRPAEELYHVAADPDCMTNRVADASQRDRLARMSAQLDRELAEQGDLRSVGRGGEYEAHPYADATGTNFWERWVGGNKGELKAGWVNATDFEDDFYRRAPSIVRFEASAASVAPGGRCELRWSVDGEPTGCAATIRIEPGVGFVGDEGHVSPVVAQDTVFTLTAINPKGTNTATVTVRTAPAKPGP